jgi:hypothetical protein
MAKIILRGNQESNLIWALEMARDSFDGIDEYKDAHKVMSNLLASIEKQLAGEICDCGCGFPIK